MVKKLVKINRNMEICFAVVTTYSFIHGLMLKGRRDIHRLSQSYCPEIENNHRNYKTNTQIYGCTEFREFPTVTIRHKQLFIQTTAFHN